MAPASQVAHHSVRDDECVRLACDLFEAYDGNYPPWWSTIDNSLGRLRAIFRFFCAMRPLVAASRAEPSPLMRLLHERVRARVQAGPGGLALPLTDLSLIPLIRTLSRTQLDALAALGEGLIGPGFDLFASGALSTGDQGVRTMLAVDRPIDPPEPDSGAFFYWAEFGLLACAEEIDSARWLGVMPSLLRAERIFIRCYGSERNGTVRTGMRFSWYDRSRPETRTYCQIDPQEATFFRYDGLTTRDEFQASATALAQMGMPGGVDL